MGEDGRHKNYSYAEDYDDEYLTWSWGSTICSLCSIPFCCCFGFIGTLCSALAYSDYNHGDGDGARRKRCYSWTCSILAIIIGAIITAFFLAVVLMTFTSYGPDGTMNIENGNNTAYKTAKNIDDQALEGKNFKPFIYLWQTITSPLALLATSISKAVICSLDTDQSNAYCNRL